MSSSAPTTTAAASVVHKSSFHDCSRFVENSFTPTQQKTCYTQQQHQQQHNEQKKTIIYLAGLVIRNCFQDRAIFSHLPIVNVGAASATSLLLLPFISSSLFFFFFVHALFFIATVAAIQRRRTTLPLTISSMCTGGVRCVAIVYIE